MNTSPPKKPQQTANKKCDKKEVPTVPQVNFDQDTEGFSSLELQIRDVNNNLRISATLTPGRWDDS